MLHMALKSVLARRLRLALTALAVVLGVAFVSGTYVLTDTINATFDTLFTEVYAGIDITVRGDLEDFGGLNAQIEQVGVSQEVLDRVSAVDGVDVAVGSVDGYAQLIAEDGDPIGGQGPPTIGFSWNDEVRLSPVRIRQGEPPRRSTEVVIDAATADANGFSIGDDIEILFLGGPEEFEIVGIVSFGESDGLGGATLALFDLDTARRVLQPPGDYTSLSAIADPGLSQQELATRVAAVVTEDDLGVFTGEEETQNNLDDLEEGLGFINTLLLVFAGISVFVGAFIIQNTFRIIVAQRTRELAVLRALGASGRQVTRLVVVEAFVVALIASAVGVVAGIGLASLLRLAMDSFGFGLPSGPLTVLLRTVIAGMAVGVGVTVAAAILPARRAAKVPPLAAMRDLPTPRRSLRNRSLVGGFVTAAGALALFVGLGGRGIGWVGLGAGVSFLGVSILAPLFAKPLAGLIARPLPRVYGVTGTLARENAVRRPRRTAATASALMIGIALVAFVSILASSIKVTVKESIFDNFPAEFLVSPAAFDGGVSPDVARRLAAAPEVATVSAVQLGQSRIDDEVQTLASVDPETIGEVFNVGMVAGDLDALGSGTILVSAGAADEHGWSVGDTLSAEFVLTGEQQFTVAGIFSQDDLSPYLIDRGTFAANFSSRFDQMVFVNGPGDIEPALTRAVIDDLAAEYRNLTVEDKAEFVRSSGEDIDQLVSFFQVLLALAIIIAVLGITNTLALSVVERTREIGLLRAVGLDRRRVRRMIRWEAVVVAIFGAVLGVALGIVFGWSTVRALADSGLDSFSLPFGELVFYVLLAGGAGMLAAVLPARKAAKMDVLAAIAYE